MRHLKYEQLAKYVKCNKEKVLVIDTETTGLNHSNNEILQISLLNGYGTVLFSSYIKPKQKTSWARAQKINHITPSTVENAPLFSEVKSQIQSLFDNAKFIVGYNLAFDIKFVEAADISITHKTFIDVLQIFKSYKNKANVNTKDNKLITCAEYFDVPFNAHDALSDAQATLKCLNKIINYYESDNNQSEKFDKLQGADQQEKEKSGEKNGKRTHRFHMPHLGRWYIIICCFIIGFVCMIILGISPMNMREQNWGTVNAVHKIICGITGIFSYVFGNIFKI